MAYAYILVEVTYDYHRFQENRGAFGWKETAENMARLQNKKFPIYDYEAGSAEEEALNKAEKNHWWIQKMKVI